MTDQPFGPESVRAIGTISGKGALETYNIEEEDWSSGETDLPSELREAILERMRAAVPTAFGQG